MDFWKILKYVLMALFTGIIICGIVISQNDPQLAQPVQQSGSKFNL